MRAVVGATVFAEPSVGKAVGADATEASKLDWVVGDELKVDTGIVVSGSLACIAAVGNESCEGCSTGSTGGTGDDNGDIDGDDPKGSAGKGPVASVDNGPIDCGVMSVCTRCRAFTTFSPIMHNTKERQSGLQLMSQTQRWMCFEHAVAIKYCCNRILHYNGMYYVISI